MYFYVTMNVYDNSEFYIWDIVKTKSEAIQKFKEEKAKALVHDNPEPEPTPEIEPAPEPDITLSKEEKDLYVKLKGLQEKQGDSIFTKFKKAFKLK